MILILLCYISSQIHQFREEEKIVHFTKVDKEYSQLKHTDFRNIQSSFFKYSSNGDKINHTLLDIFDNTSFNINKSWVAKSPSTKNFKNSIFINFSIKSEIKTIIYDAFYSSETGQHRFSGFPLITKVYSSLTENSPFQLQATFSGDLPIDKKWQKIQFFFNNSIICKRLQIEFVKVSSDFIFSNSDECPVARKINFIGKLLHYEKNFTPISRQYKITEYVNLHKISINDFTYSTTNVKSNNQYLFNQSKGSNITSFKFPLFVNFTKPTTIEAILFFPSTTFHDFPLNFTVYISTENKPFLLHTIFSGTIQNCEPIQFIFEEAITCDKLRIEISGINDAFSEKSDIIFLRPHRKSEINLNEQLPTPLPERTIYPGTADTYINKVFNGPLNENNGQIVTGSDNIYQVSGCHFTDPGNMVKNYLIRVLSDIPIYDNVFENTNFQSQPIGIFWCNFHGQLTITNCKFIRIASKSIEGCCFVCNDYNIGNITIEKCQFIDCGKISMESQLFSISNPQSSIGFYDCNFTFSEFTEKCRVIDIVSNKALFDNCCFFETGNCSINLFEDQRQQFSLGSFQFTNNYVASNRGGYFIYAEIMRSKPIICNNTFYNITITNSDYFIYLFHNQIEIELYNNTFDHINTSGNKGSTRGGIATFIENVDFDFTIKINECKFNDVTNSNQGGGAFQHINNSNVHIEIIKCYFSQNKAKLNGGAVSIRTTKSVKITECTFESNIANNKNELSSNQGFGGAIYLNPSFKLNNNDYCMNSVTISNCIFRNNHAVKGCAIYIDGEDCSTVFNIVNNEFYNLCDNIQCNGGFIACEISNISKRKIISSNVFYNSETCINNESFIYTDHLGNQIADSIIQSELDIPVSLSIEEMKITGQIGCTYVYQCTSIISDKPCGKQCWPEGDRKTTLEYTFKGEGFQVYGAYRNINGRYSIYLDNELLETINQQNLKNNEDYVLQFTSRVLPYKEHTVKIAGIGEVFDFYKVTYWPSLKAKRLNASDMEKIGKWTAESDKIGGLRYYTTDLGSVIKKTIGCSKFWVIGGKGYVFTKFTVSFGDFEDEIDEHIDEYSEYNVLVYESSELQYDLNQMIFTSQGAAEINCIYYESENNLSPTLAPTQSQTSIPTQSQTSIPTQSLIQSKTFTPISEIHQSESKSLQISAFSDSFISLFSESVNQEITNDFSYSSITNDDISSTDKKEKKKKKFTKTNILLVTVLAEIAILIVIIIVILIIVIKKIRNQHDDLNETLL